MYSFCKKIGLFAIVIILLFGTSGCRLPVPLPPHAYIRAPHVPTHARARHHYRYFPNTQVYFDTTSNMYFYPSNNVWLSAPLLPSHIHIDLNNFMTMELDGPKPYIHHRNTLKRYPPGLRKEKHRKQREKFDTKREDRRDHREGKNDRKEEQLKPEKDRKRGKGKKKKGKKEKNNRKAIWK